MRYIATIIATLTLAATIACTSTGPAPDPTAITVATKVASAPTPTPRPTSPPPTRPKPIENIITKATQAATLPTPIPTKPPPTQPPTPASTGSATTQPAADPAAVPSTPVDSASPPPDAQFTDQVLLQDLYKHIDLDRFSLPEDYQIPRDYEGPPSKAWTPLDDPVTEYPYYNLKDHPYLHVFSTLHAAVKEHGTGPLGKPLSQPPETLPYQYRYGDSRGEVDIHSDNDLNPPTGISHMLHYPWYEPLMTELFIKPRKGDNPDFPPIPYSFGNNSTRGVLADTVTDLFEMAVQPGIRPQPIHFPFGAHPRHESSDLGGYLRTPFPPISFTNPTIKKYEQFPFSHRMPITKWQILHPELPIVQVTSYATTVLPLAQEPPPLSQMTPEQIIERFSRYPHAETVLEPIQRLFWTMANPGIVERGGGDPITYESGQEFREAQMIIETWKEQDRKVIPTLAHLPENVRRKHMAEISPRDMDNLLSYPHSLTHYAVSFVISWQHRWTSFTDPNRWLLRFRDDLQPRLVLPHLRKYPGFIGTYNSAFEFTPRLGSIDPDIDDLYPYYWHTTDYMQHRIIGPVILNVYDSDVLTPGIYALNPRISHWEAPGPILSDDRQLFTRGVIYRRNFEAQNRPLITRPLRIPEQYQDRMIKGDESDIGRVRDQTPPSTGTYGRLAILPHEWSPNPGFPLPGHVLTTPKTAPGMEVWERYNLDFHEW